VMLSVPAKSPKIDFPIIVQGFPPEPFLCPTRN
jgi:hypothetical protein